MPPTSFTPPNGTPRPAQGSQGNGESANRSARRLYQVWGLTGGIGSGKSTVAKFFNELGVPVVDADQISREVVQAGGKTVAAIIEKFGTADRTQLRKIIFSDPKARRELERILHPAIAEMSERKFEQISHLPHPGLKTPIPIIYEAALLVESGRHTSMDGMLLVTAPPSTREARVMARDGVDPQLAKQMIHAQLPDQERARFATHTFQNSSDLASLKKQITAFVEKMNWLGANSAGLNR